MSVFINILSVFVFRTIYLPLLMISLKEKIDSFIKAHNLESIYKRFSNNAMSNQFQRQKSCFLFGLQITPLLIYQSASRNGIKQKQFPVNEWASLHGIILGGEKQQRQSVEMNINVLDFFQDYAMKALGFYGPHNVIYTFLDCFFKPVRPSYHIYLHIFDQNNSFNTFSSDVLI